MKSIAHFSISLRDMFQTRRDIDETKGKQERKRGREQNSHQISHFCMTLSHAKEHTALKVCDEGIRGDVCDTISKK
jgi:hypothetical protein